MTTESLVNWIRNREQEIRKEIVLADERGDGVGSLQYRLMLEEFAFYKKLIKCYKLKKYCWEHLDWLVEEDMKIFKCVREYPKYLLNPKKKMRQYVIQEIIKKIREATKRFNTIEIEEWFIERERIKEHIELFYHEPQERKPAVEALEYIEKYVINTKEKEFCRIETINALEEERPKHFNTGTEIYYLNDVRSIIANGIFDKILFWLKNEAEGYK